MIEWVQAVAATVTALVAFGALWFARGQVREMRDTRRETSQPYVVAYMEPVPSVPQFANLLIRNFGLTAAFDVTITSTPALVRPGEREAELVRVFSQLPMLAPGQAWTTFFGSAQQRAAQGVPSRFEVSIDYRDAHGRALATSRSILDWEIFDARAWIIEKGIADVAKHLKSLADRFKQVTDYGHINVMADDAVYARRVNRAHYARTGEPVLNRSDAEQAFERAASSGKPRWVTPSAVPSRRLRGNVRPFIGS